MDEKENQHVQEKSQEHVMMQTDWQDAYENVENDVQKHRQQRVQQCMEMIVCQYVHEDDVMND